MWFLLSPCFPSPLWLIVGGYKRISQTQVVFIAQDAGENLVEDNVGEQEPISMLYISYCAL